MRQNISIIKNLRTIKALGGESLTIDLGETFTGTLTSWMKKDVKESEYIEFEIKENRYLFLSKNKTIDKFDTKNNISGRWIFDVRQLPEGGTSNDDRVVLTGSILFQKNITTQ